MAVDRSQADRDEAAKRQLELDLMPRLRNADQGLATQVAQSLATTGTLPNVPAITAAAYEPVLMEHYANVSSEFGELVRPQLPADVESSSEENALIAALLLAANRRRAEEQAAKMGETNDDDARFALGFARDQAREDGLSRQEEASTAGVLFLRKLRGRERGRSVTETQIPAEESKQIEAAALTGDGFEPIKEWVTVGDNLVRPHHVEVDSVQVPIDAPFTVNEELLMHPGDTSLGATASNVAQCRCSSVPDVAAIAASRR